MKTKLLLSAFLSFLFYLLSAQVPQGFNYQSIARDGAGNPIANKTILVKISILSDTTGFYSSGTGTYLWEEEHSVITNSLGVYSLVVGTKSRIQGVTSFNLIDWNGGQRFIGIKVQNPPAVYKNMGTAPLNSVPYAMIADKANGVVPGTKLSVTSTDDSGAAALFEVKRKDGQTVFAVYPDAVNIYVPRSGAKGAKGGFAIGGFDGSKANPQDYFRVTPDSVRVYIDPTPPANKGSKGGFAIGGYGGAKGGIDNMYFNLSGATSVNLVAESPQILWYPVKKAFLAGSVHIGAVDSVGQNSTALGYRSIAMGDFSQAFGYKAISYGDYSTSIGKNSVAGARTGTVSTASSAFALGNAARATGDDSYAMGSGAIASGYKSFAFGSVGLDDSGNPTSTPTTASQPYTIAIGMGAQATQKGGMALGIGALSSGYYSNSFGYYSTSSGYYSTAIGFKSTASNYYAGAFGYNAKAEGQGALALGYNSWAVNNYSTAVGVLAKTTADYASAFGRSALAQGASSVAVGYGALTGATATDAGSFGRGASANGVSSTAIGYNSEAAGDYSFAIGTYGLNADGSVNLARPTKTFMSYSVALGMGAQASQKGDMAFGVNSSASGSYSTALGYGPTASGQYSTAIGYSSTASGLYATAVGYSAQATGDKSISIGAYYNRSYLMRLFIKFPLPGHWTTSLVNINQPNIADGDYSLAIGNGNQAHNGGSAFGTYNIANSIGAIALGHSNSADSSYSFATGYSSHARGNYSFAAGYSTYATGENSFAMGESVTAQAMNSFVIGTNSLVSGTKDSWVTTDPLFVIGNGGLGTQSNALVVAKNGNTTINGNLTVTGTISSFVGTGDGLGNHTATQNLKLNGYWLSNDGGSEGVFVTTGGMVGINSASPSYTLDIAGNLRTTGGIYGTAINPDNGANLTVDAGTLHIDALNNRVGINNLTPAYGLDVTGTGRFTGDVTLYSTSPAFYFTDTDLNHDDFKFEANTDVLAVTTQGKTPVTVLAMGSTGAVAMPNILTGTGTQLVWGTAGQILRLSSSLKYKTEVNSLDDISWIFNLKPVDYLYKTDLDKKRQYGLIAEDVAKINDNLVFNDTNGDPDAVNYNGLITPLLKAVQDQQKTIDALKSDNADLKLRLEKLENIINQLEKDKN